ncbi:MAG: hypothetical protein J5527_04545 [Treponema sp.]|nr:hypothetical protein [Treponema sp.]
MIKRTCLLSKTSRFASKAILISSIFMMLSALSSCKIFTINVKDYFKDATEQASINDYTTSFGSSLENYKRSNPYDNGQEYYCIPSDKDFVITFQLKNPQRYNFAFAQSIDLNNPVEKSMAVALESLTTLKNIDASNSNPTSNPTVRIENTVPSNTTEYVLLRQEDSLYKDGYAKQYYLTLTYSKDFLTKYEMGHNISPTIYLTNDSYSKPSTFSDLKIVCNSPPPEIPAPVVYQNKDKYALLFNMPAAGLVKSTHRDLKILTLQAGNITTTYNIACDNNGNITFSGTSVNYPMPASTVSEDNPFTNEDFIPCNIEFVTTGQAFYLIFDNPSSSYSFTLADEFGLTSKVSTSLNTKKLADINVTNKNKAALTNGMQLEQDNNSSYATINFTPSLNTYWFEDSNNMVQNNYYVKEGDKTVTKNFIFKIKDGETPKTDNYDNIQTPESGAYINAEGEDIKAIINSWTLKYENTSDCSIVYEVYQGTDDTGFGLFNSTFDCAKSSSADNLTSSSHYLPLKLPAGDIFVRVYARKPGFTDTETKEYRLTVLRTRLYVSANGDDDKNNGSENSPFATITNAAKTLSKQTDSKNTITITTDLTENIKLESKSATTPLYVKLAPITKNTKISSQTDDALLTVPDKATVVIEDMILEGGNIDIGENAKLYLNNVKFTGEKINISATGTLILGGDTIINNEETGADGTVTKENTTAIYIEEGGKVQLGNSNKTTPSKAYNPQKLIILKTTDETPTLNTIILETEDGSPIKQTYRAVYEDLTNEDPDKSYKLFRLEVPKSNASSEDSGGYYIGYDDTKGRGLVKISAVYLIEPTVGGYTVKLKINESNKYTDLSPKNGDYGNNIYEIKKGSKLTYAVFRNGSDLTALNSSNGNKLTDLKMELYLEGDMIEQSKENNQLAAPELTIPTAYPNGYYTIYVYFTYDKLSYCEHFLVYLKEVN